MSWSGRWEVRGQWGAQCERALRGPGKEQQKLGQDGLCSGAALAGVFVHYDIRG